MTTGRRNCSRYEMLPREDRPKYTSRADIRMLDRAIRNGWVKEVPVERIADWFEDVTSILEENTGGRKQLAALRVCVHLCALASGRERARIEAAIECLRQNISRSSEGCNGIESIAEL